MIICGRAISEAWKTADRSCKLLVNIEGCDTALEKLLEALSTDSPGPQDPQGKEAELDLLAASGNGRLKTHSLIDRRSLSSPDEHYQTQPNIAAGSVFSLLAEAELLLEDGGAGRRGK